VLIERSSVWMTACEARGNATRFVATGFGGDGGSGVFAIDSAIHVGLCIVFGGQSGGRANGVTGVGAPGVMLVASSALLHGGPPNGILGAIAFEQHLAGVDGLGAAAPALAVDGSSVARYAPDLAMVGGSESASLAAAPTIGAAIGATVVAIQHRLPTSSLSPSTASLGGVLTFVRAGQPNLPHVSAFSLETSPMVQLGGVSGALLVAMPSVFAFADVLLDSTGIATSIVTIPADPALAGLGVVQQCAQVVAGAVTLAPPALLAVR
jgi:hypothetical protein